MLKYYQVGSNDTPGWSWPILWQGQIWSFIFLYGKNGKQWIFFRNYCSLWFETSNRWPKWQDVSVDINTLSPEGCMPAVSGLYTYIKSWKKKIVLNQTWKRFLWNLQQMGKVIRPFCWHQTFAPWGLSAPAPVYIHVLNHEKIVLNQTWKKFLWNLQQMGKVIRPFCWHQTFAPWGLSAPAPRIYTCIKSWKNCLNETSKRFYKKKEKKKKKKKKNV